jgi:hypothetical protein
MIYDIAKKQLLTEDMREGLEVLLVTDSYVPDSAHQTVADVEADEFSDANYSRKTVQNVVVRDNGTSFDIDGDDLFWDATLTGTVGGVVFFYSGFLLAFFDTTDTVLDAKGFKVELDQEGIVGVNV